MFCVNVALYQKQKTPKTQSISYFIYFITYTHYYPGQCRHCRWYELKNNVTHSANLLNTFDMVQQNESVISFPTIDKGLSH